MKTPTTIIFDLDHTLYDTAAFKEAVAREVARFGPSYESVLGVTLPDMYMPARHLDALRADFATEVAMHDAQVAMYACAAKGERFLYPGVQPLLQALRRRGDICLVLLTLGDSAWQLTKIAGAGLLPYFDEVVTVEADKAAHLPALVAKEGKTIVVNDHPEELAAMRATAPECVFLAKKGPRLMPEDLAMPVARSMADVVDLIARSAGWNSLHVTQ